jgi:UDP-glucose 4-epimerase
VTILVTGGAGYIGGHVVSTLRARGDEVVVADDLSSGVAARIPGVPLVQLDLAADSAVETLSAACEAHDVDSVIHLAARKRVAESVERPEWYYHQNLGGLANVLAASRAVAMKRIVFSSSAAVYASSSRPVSESDAVVPSNPYGETKLAGEQLVAAFAAATGGRAVSLRYFNVAGAADEALADREADNLVPMVFDAIGQGQSPRIFGDDYGTPDGTCVRDYIHVADLAEAHVAALDDLAGDGAAHSIYNVGTGRGSSVREMIELALSLSGSTLSPRVEARRAGDPASVVADPSRIREALGWSARFTISEIMRSAWDARR